MGIIGEYSEKFISIPFIKMGFRSVFVGEKKIILENISPRKVDIV